MEKWAPGAEEAERAGQQQQEKKMFCALRMQAEQGGPEGSSESGSGEEDVEEDVVGGWGKGEGERGGYSNGAGSLL